MKTEFGSFLLSTVERSAWTFVQSFLGLIIVTQSPSWQSALIASGITAAQSLSISLSAWNPPAPIGMPTALDLIKDTAYRSVSTFVQSFLSIVITMHSFTGASLWAALIAAGLAVIKNLSVGIVATSPSSPPPIASTQK